MPKYYSLMLSPNISKTAEGYLICENVPLCRSGFQDYKGSELFDFPGYDPAWNLNPDEMYRVFRPKEEVLHPDFIASLEGKTVVDEHPDGSVVHVDNDGELNCGHAEKIGPGPIIDGEVTLKGDLHIKDPTLIEKVRPENDPDNEYGTAVRDVSLGYGVHLKRLEDGTIVVHRLRGNHVAVVEKGRAGPRIAIKDSAPPEIKIIKEPIMSLRKTIFGRGIQAIFGDLSQAEKDGLMAELEATGTPRLVTDAEPKEIHPAHAALDRFFSAKKANDADAAEKSKKELFEHIGHKESEKMNDEDMENLEDEDEKAKEEKAKKEKSKMEDEELEENEKTAAEESEKTHAVDAEINDPGESILKAANDSVRNYIRNSRAIVAVIANKDKSKRSHQEQVMLDSYNGAVKGLNSQLRKNGYSHFSRVKRPEGIPALATDSTAVTKTEEACNCFDGVTYRVGLERHKTAHQKGA